ncbi:MAG TPA: cytochrome b/b6 domain-containing protein [Bryobacteraceae bacterium]|nr:cytochrome b/b6 domain-containing protein [Dongiaceae bacterium]HVO97747.1 cytochrome b/b6 domain-containing protein [Bryobacteraceae bacterium]
MGILELISQWAVDPWGKFVPIHIAWFLIWVAAIAGLFFVIVHAVYVRYFAKPREFESDAPPVVLSQIPEHVPRHSLVARAFHWIMAASMLTLLFTAFLPKVGVHFNWVLYHWIAGTVLTISVLFHIVHASFFMNFWSIWPDKIDIRDAGRRVQRFLGKVAPPPDRFARYPLENKLYHSAIIAAGLSVIVTGVFMMSRVRTIFFERNPYLFSDMTWGMMYVLHGLAGVGLIFLIMVHVYFGLRPEKVDITKSMLFGWMRREFYLEHYDPQRWTIELPRAGSVQTDRDI